MKNIFTILSIFALLAVSSIAQAKVETVEGPWTLNTPSGIDFSCGAGTYSHTLNTISQDGNGNLVGTGTYDPNNAYTWDLVGNITDDNIEFTITYTGINAGAVYNNVGTISPDGSISGTTDSNCHSFSMNVNSASRYEGNHGQYVSSQDDKKTSAQSRVGMPVQSKGHTK